jgi:hypothetical protein
MVLSLKRIFKIDEWRMRHEFNIIIRLALFALPATIQSLYEEMITHPHTLPVFQYEFYSQLITHFILIIWLCFVWLMGENKINLKKKLKSNKLNFSSFRNFSKHSSTVVDA